MVRPRGVRPCVCSVADACWPTMVGEGAMPRGAGSLGTLLGTALAAGASPAWAGATERVDVGPNGRQADGGLVVAISAYGRFVVFGSYDNTLVPNDTNGAQDLFVRDLRTGRNERVSVGPHGAQADGDCDNPAISADGRFVAFYS